MEFFEKKLYWRFFCEKLIELKTLKLFDFCKNMKFDFENRYILRSLLKLKVLKMFGFCRNKNLMK